MKKLSTVRPGRCNVNYCFSYQQLFSDVIGGGRGGVGKYGNDVMTSLTTPCHSVNKSCASYDRTIIM